MNRSIKLLGLLVAVVLVAGSSFATQLTDNRLTPSKSGKSVSLVVSNGVTIYAGGMVAVDGAGEAVAAADTSGFTVVGKASEKVDNSSDGESIEVDIGIFRWVNAGAFTDANIGDICYVLDDNSVTNGAGSNSIIAGNVVDVDSSGVWVKTMDIDRTAGSFTTLAASGASTLSGAVAAESTLTITGKSTANAESEMNEDVDINLNASDEEIDIAQTAVAGAGDAGLIVINDDRTGATAAETDEATISIDAEGVYAIGLTDGGIGVDSGPVKLPYANKTTHYTTLVTDHVVSFDTSALTTNTLPEASTVLGVVFTACLQDDDGDLIVITDGTDTFDGTNNKSTMADAGDSLTVMATAANVYTILNNDGGTLGTQ
jgi:hypothetical protein